MTDTTHLKLLGETGVQYDFSKPAPHILEAFENPKNDPARKVLNASMDIEIVCPEFTSLCPKTGQPDFATIKINYRPDKLCVESKSLKLYLFSFRNHGEFHEACVTRICDDLVKLLDPEWLDVVGEFTPRGGIPFWPRVSYYKPHDNVAEVVQGFVATGTGSVLP